MKNSLKWSKVSPLFAATVPLGGLKFSRGTVPVRKVVRSCLFGVARCLGKGNEKTLREHLLKGFYLNFGSFFPRLVASCLDPESGKRDSNSRPQPWQGCALPTELFPQMCSVSARSHNNHFPRMVSAKVDIILNFTNFWDEILSTP